MCSVVPLELRRLIKLIRTAMIPAPNGIANQSDIVPPLEFEPPLAVERPADAVREGPEGRARKVVLEVARVEMVRDVEHLQTDRGVVTKYPESLAHLQVERHEPRIAAGLVPRADEIPVFV